MRRTIGILIAFVILAGFGACTGDVDPLDPTPETTVVGPDPRAGGTLRFAVEGDALGWNPVSDRWSTSAIQIARSLFEPLASYDDNNQLRPELAESIEADDDFTEWTITVRDGVRFSDGTVVDADAIRANLEQRRGSPTTAVQFEQVKSVFVTGPRTVRVLMRSPWATFAHVLTSQAGFVAAPSMFDGPSASSRPIGTGPFVVDSWQPGARMLVTRNFLYRRAGLPLVDEVDFRIVPDAQRRTDLLLDGRADVITTVDPDEISRLALESADGSIRLTIDDQGEAPKLAVALNIARPPFVDMTARQAIAFATDRRDLSDAVSGGVDDPIRGPVSPTSPWFDDIPVVEADPASARRAVEQFEQRYGHPLEFTLVVAPDPLRLGVAARWQRQLERAGIVMEIVPTDPGELADRTAIGDFEAALVEGFGDWHPDFMYPTFHQANMTPIGAPGPNPTRFGSDRIDTSLDEARSTGDLVSQVDAYRAVQEEIIGGLAYVFMLRRSEAIATRTIVRDLTSWTMSDGSVGLDFDGGVVSFTHVWLERSSS